MKKLERQLTKAEINYVLYHLSMHFHIADGLQTIIAYKQSESPKIVFPVTNYVEFPDKSLEEPYTVEGNNIVFKNDLLKSSFYLLSGYQEYEDNDLDQWQRPQWENSVQYELGFTNTPIVNYYFKWLIEGIENYCVINGIDFKRKSIWARPVLHLTHDIDTVRYYSTRRTAYRIAQLIGLRPADTKRSNILKATWRSFLEITRIKKQKNPWWSFNEIMNVEQYFGFKSTWFALPDDKGPFTADYQWTDEDITTVFERLTCNGNELGLHGPINCQKADSYKEHLKSLKNLFTNSSSNHRQHFLSVNQDTIKEMDRAGVTVDCSLGYSHSEGWRNGYCLPFHPFDHKEQKMLNIWEVPLAMMDVSVLSHKGLSFDEIYDICGQMLDEVREFNGVFSLLWHNSTFDDLYYPGILKFYEDLHLFFSQYSMNSLTTDEILSEMKKY